MAKYTISKNYQRGGGVGLSELVNSTKGVGGYAE